MKAQCVLMALALSLGVPTSVWAEKSSCHDYPGHREVLDRGNSLLESLPAPRSLDPYGFANTWTSGGELPSAQVQIKFLRDNKNNLRKENFKLLVRQIAENYYKRAQYGECRKFLESVESDLTPEERLEAMEVIARCCILEKNDNYILELLNFLNQKEKLTQTRKKNLETAMLLIQKIPKKVENPNSDLRDALIYAILGREKDAVDIKNRILQSIKQDPKKLIDDSPDWSLDSIFKGKLFHNMNSFKLRQKDNSKAPLANYFKGVLSLCRKVGTVEDLRILAPFWVKCLNTEDINVNEQALLIENLSQEDRTIFVKKCLLHCGPEFLPIYSALKKHGWDGEAQLFLGNCVDNSLESSNFPGIEKITNYFFSKGDKTTALEVYDHALTGLVRLHAKGGSNIILAEARISPLFKDLSKYNISPSNATALKTKKIYDAIKKDYDQFKCLELAEDLTSSGWSLVEKGHAKDALKLYESALDIRKKNLNPIDRTLGLTYLDAGRTAAFCNNFPVANIYLQKAIFIFNARPIKPDDDLITAMESYGSLLNKNNRYEEAQKIYAQLKEIR